MASKRNDASGASTGIAVTPANSGSSTADNFQTVNKGSNGSLIYSVKDGVTCFQATSLSIGNATTSAVWTLPSQSRVTGRIELWLPSPGPEDIPYKTTGKGNGVVWQFLLITGPSFQMDFSLSDRDATGLVPSKLQVRAGGLTIVSEPGAIPFDTWFRLEYDIQTLNPSGSFDIKLFGSRYSTTPVFRWQGIRTWTSPGIVNSLEVGAPSTLTSTSTPVSNWFGGLYVSDDGVLPAAAPPPVTTPLMSTLTDNFPTIDTAKWSSIGPVAPVNGAAELGDSMLTGYLTSVGTYQFDRAEVEIIAPGRACSLWIDAANSTDFWKIVVSDYAQLIHAEWSVNGQFGKTDAIEFDYESHRHLKIQRFADTQSAAFLVSADGLEWDALTSTGMPTGRFEAVKAILTGELASSLDRFNIQAVAPTDPDDATETPAPAPPSGFPEAIEPTCASLLDMVRDFSAQIKKPVILTGTASIRVIDPNAPLPAGFNGTDAAGMFVTTAHQLSAGETVLSMEAGDLALTVAADLLADDVRVPVSGWHIPMRLPIYGLESGPVKRVTYQFSPRGFRGSVEFAPRPVPLALRGNS